MTITGNHGSGTTLPSVDTPVPTEETTLSEATDAVRAIPDLEERGRAAVALFAATCDREHAARTAADAARIAKKNRADRAKDGVPADVTAADDAAIEAAKKAYADAQGDVGVAFELLRETVIALLHAGHPVDEVATATGAPTLQVHLISRLDRADTREDAEQRLREVSAVTSDVWKLLARAWEERMLAVLDLHYNHGRSIRDLTALLRIPASTVTNMRIRQRQHGTEVPHRADSEVLAVEANADVAAIEPVAEWALELRQEAVLDTLRELTQGERPVKFAEAWRRLAELTGLSETRLKLIRRPLIASGEAPTAQKEWQRLLPALREIVTGLGPGKRLPGEWALAKQLGREHRSVVWYALHALAEEGLVEPRRGVGWFTTTKEQRAKLKPARKPARTAG